MGSSFGKYRLIAELGQGGMADIFLGVAQGPMGFTKLVVLKRVLARLADDPTFASMFIDEARLAARLQHPNVVQTYEAGEIDGQYFIAMEYLEGQSLDRIIRRTRGTKSLDPHILYCVLIDALAGLQYAHELSDYDGTPLGVVHRDATPQNIFVTYDGQVKVVDFGIAKAARRTTEATQAGVLKGKTAYMAPEQVAGKDLDGRCDVFAAGVMLWEMATGQRMWAGFDEVGILGRLLTGDIRRSPREVVADVPLPIDRICQRALAPKVEDRYASAEEMQQELEQYVGSIGKRPSRREIGEHVTELFSDKRAKIRGIIEEKLASLEQSDSCEIETRLAHEASSESGSGAQSANVPQSIESLSPQEPGSLTIQFVDTQGGYTTTKSWASRGLVAGVAATVVVVGVALTVLRGPGEQPIGAVAASSPPPATALDAVEAAAPLAPSDVSDTTSAVVAPLNPSAQASAPGSHASAQPEQPTEPRSPTNVGTKARTTPVSPTTATAATPTTTTSTAPPPTTATTTTTPTTPPGKLRRPIEYGDPLEE